MGNQLRLERITHWFTGSITLILVIIIFVLSTVLFVFLTRRYFNTGTLRYFTTVFWIPYYIILVYLFSSLVPMNNRADEPSNALGLILIAIFFCYPFFIASIIAFCTND